MKHKSKLTFMLLLVLAMACSKESDTCPMAENSELHGILTITGTPVESLITEYTLMILEINFIVVKAACKSLYHHHA